MQKQSVTVIAPAKLNLSLDVRGLLPNGYHDLDMVMQAITLREQLTLRRSESLTLRMPGSTVPVNDKNTAVKAALAFFDYTGLLAGGGHHHPQDHPGAGGHGRRQCRRCRCAGGHERAVRRPPVHERTVRAGGPPSAPMCPLP